MRRVFIGCPSSRALQTSARARILPSLFYPSLRSNFQPFRYFSTENSENGLDSIISQGMKALQENTADVQSRTRKKLGRDEDDDGPSPNQIMEGQRLLNTITECLDQMATQEEQTGKRSDRKGGLHISGEPIVILHVEVNKNLRQAKVYWALPFGILLDDRIDRTLYRKVLEKMDERVQKSSKLLQGLVHTRLRSYYPPRLRFLQATDAMISEVIDDVGDF